MATFMARNEICARVAYFVAIRVDIIRCVDSSNVRLLHVQPDVIIFDMFFFFAFFPCFTLSTIFEAYILSIGRFQEDASVQMLEEKGRSKSLRFIVFFLFFSETKCVHTRINRIRGVLRVYIYTHTYKHTPKQVIAKRVHSVVYFVQVLSNNSIINTRGGV